MNCGGWGLLGLASLVAAGAAPLPLPADQRVAELAGWLPAEPRGLGPQIADRAAWTRLDCGPALLERGEATLQEPLAEVPEELYLEFSRTGNRTRYQNAEGRRRSRLPALALAECVEAQGRFLPALEATIRAVCTERAWVLPAHDGQALRNFKGETIDIDLWSSALGWELATIDWLLGDRLTPAVRTLLREQVTRRVVEPYRAMVSNQQPANWWITTTNNWNAVCAAGTLGTILVLVADRGERARLAAATELHVRHFLRGFTADGYCSEGLGYWGYGFGHYLLLAELLAQATGGRLDLLADPQVRAPATFAARIGLTNQVYPAFADCGVGSRPDDLAMYHVNRRYQLGLTAYDTLSPRSALAPTFTTMLYRMPNTLPAPGPAAASGPGLRDWFDAAGILIGRPAEGAPCRLSVALKGGHNAEHHNHNDVGSYVVALGHEAVLLDPGAETYTARTFSSRRYESQLLNSFGHPVPQVAGQLQRPGGEARGRVVKTEFTPARDTLVLDLTSCYAVPELVKLERTFVYDRTGEGALEVSDAVEFRTPQTFGSALLTAGGWQARSDSQILVWSGDAVLAVTIHAEGAPWRVEAQPVVEESRIRPTRLGLNLTAPVTTARLTCRITPGELPDDGRGGLLRNGGFELDSFAWSLQPAAMCSLGGEQTRTGRSALHLVDRERTSGSNITSAPLAVAGEQRLVLSGWAYHVSGSGVGLYVHFLDAAGKVLNVTDARGNLPALGTAPSPLGQWAEFRFPFTTPPGTAAMRVWIHSANAAQVDVWLDDLAVTAAP